MVRALGDAPEPGTTLVAGASIAGALDLDGIAVPNALAGRSATASLYLAYLTNAYAAAYGEPLDGMLAAPHAARVPTLFAGGFWTDTIRRALPPDPRALFRPAFLARFESGDTTFWFRRALRANSVAPFTPAVPLRLYVGTADVDVSPTEATTFAARVPGAVAAGRVRVVPLEGADHAEAARRALPKVRRWLDSLVAPSPPRMPR